MMMMMMIMGMAVVGIGRTMESNECNQRCGGGGDEEVVVVPYPFGFSEGCQIRLNCSGRGGGGGEIQMGDFHVLNVTPHSIIVSVPADCGRPINTINQLYHHNYAPTWGNTLIFHNCTTPSSSSSSCIIPTSALMDTPFHCPSSTTHNLNCYSLLHHHHQTSIPSSYPDGRSNCSSFVSSMVVAANSLDFERLELAWWLDGHCDCHTHANCTSLSLPNNTTNTTTSSPAAASFRCQCNQGFHGDGFRNGHGCHKVSDCNASRWYMSGGCGRSTRVGFLLVGVIAGASLMATLALICHCIRKRSSLKKQTNSNRLLCEAAGGSSIPFFPYKEIERATNGFCEKQRLGTGAYGTVYAGKLNSDDWVAIKKIRHRDSEGIEQVMNEIKLLSSVSHPNLVRLLGCCIENGEQILVYEYMANGTLSQHLQRERGGKGGLPWTIRLTIATETAHAIAHLHSAMNPPIYHRDIKSSNILLDYNFNSKVADFGLSRLGMADDSHISTAPQGTPGYVDPQYHQNFHLSDKSDVYSFGVVLAEIITGLKVVDFSRPHTEINLAALATERIVKGHVDEIIDPFLDPHRDAWTLSSVHKVAELAFRCLAFHRDMRPTMMEVADELEQIRLSGWAPMDDNITCMASSSVASTCSSPCNQSDKSLGATTTTIKKIGGGGSGSRRLLVPQRPPPDCPTSTTMEDNSPVSVQDPWLSSDHSSPSTNSLLPNVIRSLNVASS